jgi:hypothetical protein
MPFITTSPSTPAYVREICEIQDIGAYREAQARREKAFRVRFSICLIGAVFVGSFLFFSAVLYISPMPG